MWAVFSHRLLATPRDNQLRIHAQLLGYGPRVASVRSRGARADLYDPAKSKTSHAFPPKLGPIPPAQPGGRA